SWSTMETAFREADLAPVARARIADQLAAQAQRSRALLGEAILAGDWQPFVDELRSLAARCAALGIKFASWYAVAGMFRQRLFRRSAVALLGQPLTILMPARLREAHAHGLARYLATREALVIGKTLEMPALRSDGTEIAIELSITTWTARGEISFAAIIRDIS